MAMIKREVHIGDQPDTEAIKEVREAANRPIVYDEDSPELTEEQYTRLAEQARARKKKQKKVVVSLRLSPQTVAKAKATGKGYTGFLSRLIDNAIDDEELVKKSL